MEFFPISVDGETSGPVPGLFSLLQIGACVVEDDSRSFQCDLKPICDGAEPEAMAVTGLTLERQQEIGLYPEVAMGRLLRWVEAEAAGRTPVFVGMSAAFDWMFFAYYFHRYCGRNPFHHSPIDIKAYWMGKTGCGWDDTRSSRIDRVLSPTMKADHTPLADARYQAELFRLAQEWKPA